ncbi:hypothetical protein BpHYR1_030066, partial [Brachionus plicatilis]
MGCASSKNAEDKDEMRKHSKQSPQSSLQAQNASINLNGKANKSKGSSTSNANNISGSLSQTGPAVTAAGATSADHQASAQRQNPSQNAYTSGGPATQSPSQIEQKSALLLTEFFKAVGNGELDSLKQILASVDELGGQAGPVRM